MPDPQGISPSVAFKATALCNILVRPRHPHTPLYRYATILLIALILLYRYIADVVQLYSALL